LGTRETFVDLLSISKRRDDAAFAVESSPCFKMEIIFTGGPQ
jgi:hypothetical protein